MSGEVERLIEEYRIRLLERDTALRSSYVSRWEQVEQRLQGLVDALSLEVESMRASGVEPTRWRLYQMGRYQDLLTQTQREISQFDRFVSGAIEREQYLAWHDGIDYASDSIRTLWSTAGIDLRTFSVLDVDRVKVMMGLTADHTPLYDLLYADYPTTIARITNALTEAMALGYNPRKTARMIVEAMRWSLQRALLVSRTEQMRAHRIATVDQLRESGVVTRYRRRAVQSLRTCLACLLEDGKVYQLRDQFSDHPNGRCTCEVELVDVPFQDVPLGRDYLLSLPKAKQIDIMGEERWNMWNDGIITLDDMSTIHDDPIWGESPIVIPLRDLRGE